MNFLTSPILTIKQASHAGRDVTLRPPVLYDLKSPGKLALHMNWIDALNDTFHPEKPDLILHQVSHKRRLVTMAQPVAEGSSVTKGQAAAAKALATMT